MLLPVLTAARCSGNGAEWGPGICGPGALQQLWGSVSVLRMLKRVPAGPSDAGQSLLGADCGAGGQRRVLSLVWGNLGVGRQGLPCYIL